MRRVYVVETKKINLRSEQHSCRTLGNCCYSNRKMLFDCVKDYFREGEEGSTEFLIDNYPNGDVEFVREINRYNKKEFSYPRLLSFCKLFEAKGLPLALKVIPRERYQKTYSEMEVNELMIISKNK